MNTDEFERLLKSNEVAFDVSPEHLLQGAKRARARRRVAATAVTAAVVLIAGAVTVPVWQLGLKGPDPAGDTSAPMSAAPDTASPTATTQPPATTAPAKVAPPAVCQIAWPRAWEAELSAPAPTGRYTFPSGEARDAYEGSFTWQGGRQLTFDNSQYFVDADDRYLVAEQSAGEVQGLEVYDHATGAKVHTVASASATPFGALADGRVLYVAAQGSENAPNSTLSPDAAVSEVTLVTLATGKRTVLTTVPTNEPYHVALLPDAVLVNGKAYGLDGEPTSLPGQPDGATDRVGTTWANATTAWRPGWNAPLTYRGGEQFTLRANFVLTDLRDGGFRLLDLTTGAQAEITAQRVWLTRDSLVIKGTDGRFRQAPLEALTSKARC